MYARAYGAQQKQRKKSEFACIRGVFSNFESLRRGGRGVRVAKGPGQSKGVGGLIPDGLQSKKLLCYGRSAVRAVDTAGVPTRRYRDRRRRPLMMDLRGPPGGGGPAGVDETASE